jgi:hypothetical protein
MTFQRRSAGKSYCYILPPLAAKYNNELDKVLVSITPILHQLRIHLDLKD